MISSDAMRGYNDALILAILQQGDSYGYKIGKEIRERTRWSIPHSRNNPLRRL